MPTTPDQYLHGHHDSVLRSHRWRTADNSAGYLLGQLAPDARLLDVGCGPGTITVDLAARVPGGQVTGIDRAPTSSPWPGGSGPPGQRNVRFQAGDVYHLGFDSGKFDVVHAHQVLQHLSDPVGALPRCGASAVPAGWSPPATATTAGCSGTPTSPSWPSGGPVPAGGPGARRRAGRRPPDAVLGAGGRPRRPRRRPAARGATPRRDDRSWWGGLWAERLTDSPFGDRAVEHGLATREDLTRLAAAWLRWADADDAWFFIPHGEILCHVPG